MGYYEDACRLAERLGMGIVPRDEPAECIAKTPKDLAQVIVDRMKLLEMDASALSARSGVGIDSIERLARTGKGTLDDVHSALEALNLVPVCLPLPVNGWWE